MIYFRQSGTSYIPVPVTFQLSTDSLNLYYNSTLQLARSKIFSYNIDKKHSKLQKDLAVLRGEERD